jgi:hypothetical protein
MREIDFPNPAINNLQRREIQAAFFAYLIQGFIKELGFYKAMEVASAAIREDAMDSGRRMAGKYGGNGTAELLRMVREVWAEGDAVEFDILEETELKLGFNVTRCGYVELYERLGMKEFGFCLSCNRDDALLLGFNPRMKLIRTQTIMQGAPVCDFRISVE